METLYTKMQEYLQMETEISFQEFTEYYGKVLDYLLANFDRMSREEKLKGKFIVTLVESNSADRAKRKGSEMKKYKKMQEKMSFWNNAIVYNLTKSGMTEAEIEEALQQLSGNEKNAS